MAAAVLAVWLVGAAVTKYSLEQMAYYTPIAMVVVGATVGLVAALGEDRARLAPPPPRRDLNAGAPLQLTVL